MDLTVLDIGGSDIVKTDCEKGNVSRSNINDFSGKMMTEFDSTLNRDISCNKSLQEDVTSLRTENYRCQKENSELLCDLQDVIHENSELLQLVESLESRCTDMETKYILLSTERDIMKKKIELFEVQKLEIDKRLLRSEAEQSRLAQESVSHQNRFIFSDTSKDYMMKEVSKQLKDIFSDLKRRNILDCTGISLSSVKLRHSNSFSRLVNSTPWSSTLGVKSNASFSVHERRGRRHTLNNVRSFKDSSGSGSSRFLQASEIPFWTCKEPLTSSQCSQLISKLKEIIDIYFEKNKGADYKEEIHAKVVHEKHKKLTIRYTSLQQKLRAVNKQHKTIAEVNSKIASLLENLKNSESRKINETVIDEMIKANDKMNAIHIDLGNLLHDPKERRNVFDGLDHNQSSSSSHSTSCNKSNRSKNVLNDSVQSKTDTGFESCLIVAKNTGDSSNEFQLNGMKYERSHSSTKSQEFKDEHDQYQNRPCHESLSKSEHPRSITTPSQASSSYHSRIQQRFRFRRTISFPSVNSVSMDETEIFSVGKRVDLTVSARKDVNEELNSGFPYMHWPTTSKAS